MTIPALTTFLEYILNISTFYKIMIYTYVIVYLEFLQTKVVDVNNVSYRVANAVDPYGHCHDIINLLGV